MVNFFFISKSFLIGGNRIRIGDLLRIYFEKVSNRI